MELKLLYFGVSRDHANKEQERLNVKQDLTVYGIRKELKQRYPALADIESFAIAVNESYAEDDLKLADGDTVAVIPPVSGG
jgi:molybdopterin converting factor subunit 1